MYICATVDVEDMEKSSVKKIEVAILEGDYKFLSRYAVFMEIPFAEIIRDSVHAYVNGLAHSMERWGNDGKELYEVYNIKD